MLLINGVLLPLRGLGNKLNSQCDYSVKNGRKTEGLAASFKEFACFPLPIPRLVVSSQSN